MSTSDSTAFTLTANQIIEQAFHKLGKASEGEAMSARMYQDGRDALNLLIKTWGAREHLWTLTERSLSLVADQAAYVLTPKPMRIMSVRRRQTTSGYAHDTEMYEMARSTYFNQPTKTSSPSTPVAWYFDPQRTTGTLYLWPAPVAGILPDCTLQITEMRKLEDILASGDEADLPQEWLETLVWNLADRLETEYPVNDTRLAVKIERRAAQLLADLQSFDTEMASIYMQPEYDPWMP